MGTDRAEQIAAEIVGERKWLPSPQQDVEECVALIAAALRSYADEKLEEAALLIEEKDGYWQDAIRELKSTPATKELQT